ncbi:MAG: tRNA (adenosine(37)-N6)-dimethylallyltransferase MiaA [Acetobacter sp.]|nr:tRNA (adenosine(37)-N6)-dimethylallyltransferase MiaA [Bacteroides sp.]MCM1340237.1 tRNA (adenosine(37)-N6)-dimethylallyltransferase MiaA [Acetobacter sp.]MCM1432811.1 tRNA (adenosine(37)-N6)-dimethylallyltransferase MiaA [Clostridiales bacterium]
MISKDNKKKIIVVAGPTASGKTAIGIEIAKAINGEVISADSMQVYKGMSIATAAPTKEETSQIPHHLIEFLSPDENFSVALWCELARKKIDDITARGKIPVIVGGTGLFIDSLVDNVLFENVDVNTELRDYLMQKDIDTLYDELIKADEAAAKNIHKNNKKRVVRALELYYSGVSKTQQNVNSKREISPYDTLYFVLKYDNRQVLYDRINLRVDRMAELGLADEARKMMSESTGTSRQAIGHKELKPYFAGEITFENALENLKKETRHYAKRQITWFKRRENAYVLAVDSMGFEQAAGRAVKICKEFFNG